MSNVNRVLKNGWLNTYRDYIIRQESPDLFHFWSSLQAIGVALKRNIWLDRGTYKVYPNQYILLIARSGSCRKSAAMELALGILDQIEGINILYGRVTPEALMDEMSKAAMSPDGKIRPDGSVFIYADELAWLFGKASYITDLMTLLTTAYTGRAKVDLRTRNKGVAQVRNACPSLIAACTPEQLGEIFPSMALVSGFLGRILMVFYDGPVLRVSKAKINKALVDPLIHDLYVISQLYGEMKLTPEAEEAFDKWYEAPSIPTTPELMAFFERKHDHVLKTAMCISVSESDSLILTIDHLVAAIAAVENVESRLPDAIGHIGVASEATTLDLVEKVLATYPEPVPRSVLLRRVYRKVQNVAMFDQIIESLKQQRRIREFVDKRTIYYQIRRHVDVE